MNDRKSLLDVIREGIDEHEDTLRRLYAAEAALTRKRGARRTRPRVKRPTVVK